MIFNLIVFKLIIDLLGYTGKTKQISNMVGHILNKYRQSYYTHILYFIKRLNTFNINYIKKG